MGHRQWVEVEAERWHLAKSSVAAVRARGTCESIYFVTVLLELHLA